MEFVNEVLKNVEKLSHESDGGQEADSSFFYKPVFSPLPLSQKNALNCIKMDIFMLTVSGREIH